ncbi:MAG: sugar transferase [Desulfobacterales bacterium]|uniref:Sugar transferase n=1 Tax=Candidatus Desulfatibia profunda TaxID=2841695 RepID=A0A8J6NLR2_9BACT|nr:sugar transferase [Candidatus Desulfatibia profunda]MBL7196443.1 sugar transferase [Desulfobacterales bacterium]
MKIGRSHKHYSYCLFVLDIFVCTSSFAIAYWIRHFNQFPSISQDYISILPYIVVVWVLSLWYFELYKLKFGIGMELMQILKAGLTGMSLLLAISFFYRGFSFSRIATAVFITILIFSTYFSRMVLHLFLQNILKSIKWQQQVLVIGCGEVGKKIITELCLNTSEYRVVGFLDDDESLQHTYYYHVPCQGKISDLGKVLDRNPINEVIIAFPSASQELYQKIMHICSERDIKYRFVPKLFQVMLQDITIDVLDGVPLVGIKGNNLTGFNYLLKRGFDIFASLFSLIILSPILVFTALLIKIMSPGPVFFTQERFGYNKQPFQFYKFRSMHHNTDESIHEEYVKNWINNGKESAIKDGNIEVHKLTNDPRIIPHIGKFIRKYSIDELPQLFNVLNGDMSLVGPRPCLQYEMEQYKPWHKARFDALPGITGLWQVSGRNRITFDEMVRLDISYLQNWSFEKDIIILLKTPFVVLFDKAY